MTRGWSATSPTSRCTSSAASSTRPDLDDSCALCELCLRRRGRTRALMPVDAMPSMAGGEQRTPALRSREEADRLVLEIVGRHAESLLAVARRHSLCPDDAQDAYQRAMEILL